MKGRDLLLSVLLVLFLAGIVYQHYQQQTVTTAYATTYCADLTQPCQLHNTRYRLYTDRQPAKLIPFTLTIEDIEDVPEQLEVSFLMQGMDMGPNRYRFNVTADKNRWQATIILPACIQGRKDWLMSIYVNQSNIGQVAFHSAK